jgi:hypothetical protein
MNRIGHLAAILGGLTLSMLALGATPAFAQNVPPPGSGGGPPTGPPHITTHVIATGGMPGWQITLVAALAVVADRARAARRHPASLA